MFGGIGKTGRTLLAATLFAVACLCAAEAGRDSGIFPGHAAASAPRTGNTTAFFPESGGIVDGKAVPRQAPGHQTLFSESPNSWAAVLGGVREEAAGRCPDSSLAIPDYPIVHVFNQHLVAQARRAPISGFRAPPRAPPV